MTMKAIDITGLSKTYRGMMRQRVEALKNLTLSVDSGEVFGFLGPNGAGKSTTIKTLVGQIKPTSGHARIFDQPVMSSKARLKVGYLPENPAFYDFLTGREYLELVGRCFNMPMAVIVRESARVLELLELADAADRPVRGYSKGMVQRLGLAQAMLHDPDLYILDEPMSGLDPVGRALVKQIMLDLKRRGKTVFFSTHVIADVEAVCDRVGIVAKGELCVETAVSSIIVEGVDGYLVRLEQEPPASLQEYRRDYAAVTSGELFGPREELGSFMQKVEQAGCSVQLIEPHRKSLEDFFLRIIKRDNS
jgi:ABC-2 type transport system ATP-binding protein